MDVNEASDHIFGLVLMNDWSGMDIILFLTLTYKINPSIIM